MVVITLTDSPPALRGDLTKWLQQIGAGVYVGQVNARVRDELWERVKEHVKAGRAAMVYSADNEQRMDFRVHNTGWEPIDFDGLKLVLRPHPSQEKALEPIRRGYSNAAKWHVARRMAAAGYKKSSALSEYVVLDVETTGLDPERHEIIEIGAVRVSQGRVVAEYYALVNPGAPIPMVVSRLTGITDEMLVNEGTTLAQAVSGYLAFAGEWPVVAHNTTFDQNFLAAACERLGFAIPVVRCIDTLALARQLIKGAKSFQLAAVLEYLGIQADGAHRCRCDCMSTMTLYEKLMEIQDAAK